MPHLLPQGLAAPPLAAHIAALALAGAAGRVCLGPGQHRHPHRLHSPPLRSQQVGGLAKVLVCTPKTRWD